MRVVANSLCPHLSNQDDVFGLLQAARNGVLTTVVGREANPGTLVRSEFERRIDPPSGRVLSMTVQRDSAVQTPASFFTARTGEEFVRLGFTDPKPAGPDYMGLTADLLLDEGFTTGYCFRIVAADPSRPNQIGLGFAAPSHKSGRVDVDGALWMDTVTRSLRDMVYRYSVRSPQDIHASGRTSFIEMANGIVLVDEWSIRMQGMAMDTTAGGKVVPTPRTIEGGGALLRAAWPDGTMWRAPLGTLTGLARLHGSDTAVANLALMLGGTNYWTVTDPKGRFVLDDLLPGPYSLHVVDPALRDLGLTMPTALLFAAMPDSTIDTAIAVPTVEDYVRDLCRKNKTMPGPVTLLGRVFGGNGRPVEDAEVLFSSHDAEPFFKMKTGADGLFYLCFGASRTGDTIDIRVRHRGDPDLHEIRTLGDKATLLRLSLGRPKP